MDPNEALKDARKATARIQQDSDETQYEIDGMAVGDLVDAFEALDQWLSRGGAFPEEWDGPWKDTPDSPGWWLLDEDDYMRHVRIHVVEPGQKGRWKKLRIPTKGEQHGQ